MNKSMFPIILKTVTLISTVALSEGVNHAPINPSHRYTDEGKTQSQLSEDFAFLSDSDTLIQQRQTATQRYGSQALEDSLSQLSANRTILNADCIQKVTIPYERPPEHFRAFRGTFITRQPADQSITARDPQSPRRADHSKTFGRGSIESRNQLPVQIFPGGTVSEPMMNYFNTSHSRFGDSINERISIVSRNASNEFQIFMDHQSQPGARAYRTKTICRAVMAPNP